MFLVQQRIRYWTLLLATYIKLFKERVSPSCALSFSSDSQLIAFTSIDASVLLFNLNSRKSYGLGTGHRSRPCALAISSDKQLLATSLNDGIVRLWTVTPSMACDTAGTSNDVVQHVVLSPCGHLVAACWEKRSAKVRILMMMNSYTNLGVAHTELPLVTC
jgi:WD40 repeat protein